MKKRVLSRLLCLCLVFALLPITVWATITDGYDYDPIFDHGSMITYGTSIYKYNGTDTVVHIPAQLGGYPVMRLSPVSFSQNTRVKQITMPDSVIEIYPGAFQECSSLESIVLSKGLTTIEARTFMGCTALKDVSIPDGVKTIEGLAFHGCGSLEHLTLPTGITSMGYSAFGRCESLKNMVIPPKVTQIAEHLFYDCTSLQSVLIGAEVTSIGTYAFCGCTNLTDIYYMGTQAQWDKITIGDWNKSLMDATIHVAHVHSYVATNQPPCTQGGTKIYRCVCTDSYTQQIPAQDHNIKKVAAQAATCTKDGNNEYYICTTCGMAFQDEAGTQETTVMAQTLPAFGHTWDGGVITTHPTVTADGVKTYTCTVCHSTRTEPIAMLQQNFADVDNRDFYATPVAWAVANHITQGTTGSTFSPLATCTREQVVTFLWRAKGSPEPTSKTNPFGDVQEGDYSYKAILWAVEHKITAGTSATTFSPKAACTRGQVVTLLWRAEGKPASAQNNPFTDVEPQQYWYGAILWAVKNAITNGTSATTFSPEKTCTRGQIVTFLYRDLV